MFLFVFSFIDDSKILDFWFPIPEVYTLLLSKFPQIHLELFIYATFALFVPFFYTRCYLYFEEQKGEELKAIIRKKEQEIDSILQKYHRSLTIASKVKINVPFDQILRNQVWYFNKFIFNSCRLNENRYRGIHISILLLIFD